MARTLNTYLRTGWCSTIAPVDGPTSATPCFSSSGMMASVWGVPRVRNSADTLFSSISLRAFSAAILGSNLSSSEVSSIFWPLTPPLALMDSMYSRAPSVVSFTPAAT
ncbi:hypothetical protein D3C71_1813670 [compost metagenome]